MVLTNNDPHSGHVIDNLQLSRVHVVIKLNKDENKIMLLDRSSNGTRWKDRHSKTPGKKIGKGKEIEIEDGYEIILLPPRNPKDGRPRPKLSYYFYDLRCERASDGRELYDVREQLGSGAFANVFTGIDRQTGDEYAVKKISKSKWQKNKGSSTRSDTLMDEFKTLKMVKHKNIIQCVEVFGTADEDKELIIILEKANGGELFNRIIDHKMDENTARIVFKQMLDSVAYLHGEGIIHRDLKPENILMVSGDPGDWRIKLSDFGLARVVGSLVPATTLCGTPQYLAPEVLESQQGYGYGVEADVWSMGVILYILITGSPPFHDQKKDENGNPIPVLSQVKQHLIDYPASLWSHKSPAVKNLVERILCHDVRRRINIKQIRAHPWLHGLREMPDGEESAGVAAGGPSSAMELSPNKGYGSAAPVAAAGGLLNTSASRKRGRRDERTSPCRKAMKR